MDMHRHSSQTSEPLSRGLTIIEIAFVTLLIVAILVAGRAMLSTFDEVRSKEQALAAFAALGAPVPIMQQYGSARTLLPQGEVEHNLKGLANLIRSGIAGEDTICTVAFSLSAAQCRIPEAPQAFAFALSLGSQGELLNNDQISAACGVPAEVANGMIKLARDTLSSGENCPDLQAIVVAASQEGEVFQAGVASSVARSSAYSGPSGGGGPVVTP